MKPNLHSKLVILVILLFTAISSSNAIVEPILIDEKLESKSIGLSIEYIEDEKRSLQLTDIKSNEFTEKWKPFTKTSQAFGFSKSAYWLRFTLENNSSQELNLFLEQSYPLIDYIDLYEPITNKDYKVTKTGDFYPFAQRPVEYQNFLFPLNLKNGESKIFYMRYQTTSSMNIILDIISPDYFYKKRNRELPILWIFYGFLIVMIVYNLFVYASVRDIAYLYYVLFVFLFMIIMMTLNGLSFQYLWPNSIWWANNCISFLLGLINYAIISFIWTYVRADKYITKRYFLNYYPNVLAFFGLFTGILSLFLDNYRLSIILTAGTTGVGLVIAFPYIIYIAFKKERQAYFLLIAFAFFLIGVGLFISRTFGLIGDSFIAANGMQIGSAIQVVLLSLGLADQINQLKNDLQVLNVSLEDKVVERTQQLQESFNEVKALKDRQDGDYFLTSLLIKPLQTNHNKSKSVETEFSVEQYKKFSFRKKTSEVGGDLCLTESVLIDGRNYTFFLNADAMGKSMQGAGGVLVLGAAVKSHLNVAKSGKLISSTPETWLFDLYLELQSLFISFDGAMLVSLVIGLADELTGMVYYVNSEHPWVVLYRDKSAKFIENDVPLRKLGTPDGDGALSVSQFQMLDQDILIIGSDGKDDILIKDSDGNEELNFDESLALKWITDGEGDVNKIVELIKDASDLKDDISLLSVKFNKPA